MLLKVAGANGAYYCKIQITTGQKSPRQILQDFFINDGKATGIHKLLSNDKLVKIFQKKKLDKQFQI